jgi:hypothetical protein
MHLPFKSRVEEEKEEVIYDDEYLIQRMKELQAMRDEKTRPEIRAIIEKIRLNATAFERDYENT